MERRAELRERAEKIKAKEERRKANKEKRDKKSERDQEAKERQGYQECKRKLPEGQITLSGFVRKPKGYLQLETSIDKKSDTKEAKPDKLKEMIEAVLEKEVKQRRRVRFVEPETPRRIRLPLKLKSPPIATHPSSPQSGSQERIASLEIGSPLIKQSFNNDVVNEDWASFFPSDTQVGRELRKWSPLSDDGACDYPQRVMPPSESSNGIDRIHENQADQFFFTQSVWDSFPSDTQVQRELDASPLLSHERPDRHGSYCVKSPSVAIRPGARTSTRVVNNHGLLGLDDSCSKRRAIEICLSSSFGMEDFPDEETEDDTIDTIHDLNASSTQWLPSSTAEVSAFFDTNIDD